MPSGPAVAEDGAGHEPVCIEGAARFIEEDFIGPFTSPQRRASRASTFALCVALLLISVLLAGRQPWLAGFAGALGLLFGFLGLWQSAAPRYLARQHVRGLSDDEIPVRFRFDEEGLTISGSWGTSFYRYRGIHAYRECGSTLLVQTGPVLRTVVPKRAFRPEDLEIVRSLLGSRVRPRPGAAEPGTRLVWRHVALWVGIVLLLLMAAGVIHLGRGP